MNTRKLPLLLTLAIPTAAVAQEPTPAPAPAPAADAPAPAPAPAADAPAPEVVELATVDGEKITSEDVETALRMQFGPRLDAMSPDQRAMAIKHAAPQVAEELIARQLLLAAAKGAKAEAKAGELEKTLEEIKGSLPPGMSFADYAKSVGKDEAEFKATLAEELAISAHIRSRLDALPKATDDQIAKFYEENKENFVTEESVRASHILLKTDPAAGEDGKKAKLAEIEKLRQQLIDAKGEGFDKLATEHSDCPSGARSGGDLGNFGRGQMVPQFDEAAFSQKPGEIGEVVETQFGYHIVLVTEKTEAGQQPLDAVKDQIAGRLDGQNHQENLQAYIKELESKAKVTRSDAIKPAPAPAPAPAPQGG